MSDIKTMSDIYEVLRHLPHIGETETVNKMFDLFSKLQNDLLGEVVDITNQVRTECRDSDEEWDKGGECKRIADAVKELLIRQEA
jgi:hypothetical protein